jgi:RHS repeat-associated protein
MSITDNIRTSDWAFFEYKKIIGAAAWNNKAFMFVNKDSSEYATHFTTYTPPDSIWTESAPLPAIKSASAAASLEGAIYVAGGYSSTYFNALEKFTPDTNTFESMASMTNARSNLVLAAAGGKLYAMGGKNASSRTLNYVEEYNPATNTWQTKASLPLAIANMACAVYNGNIYIFGGNNAARSVLRNVRMYNPSANTWDSTKAEMPHPIGFAGSAAAGSLYMVGGTDGYNEIPVVFEYSPLLDKWFTWDGPNFTAWSRPAAISDGKLFVFGGEFLNGRASTSEYAAIERFTESYRHMGDEMVNLSGNFARNYTDMEYKAPGFNVVFGRTYNSHDDRDASSGNVISKGWTFGFQGSIDTTGNDAVVRLPNGGGYIFAQNTVTGVYTATDSRMKLVKSGTNYIMTSPDQYTYTFNSDGKMNAMKDPYGNTVTLTLDSAGRVTGVTDQVGRTSSIAYEDGRISLITDPAGRTVQYTYNTEGQLIKITDPGSIVNYSYNTEGLLNKITDSADGIIEEIVYETLPGKTAASVKTIKDINGKIMTYSYNPTTGMVSETDQNSRESTIWFDQSIYPVRTKDAEGRETYTEYFLDGTVNRYGEVKLFTDKYGNTTSYERDENGNVTRIINPDSSTKVYTYNNKNMLTSEKDESGRFTYYVYASDGVTLSKEAKPLNGTDVYSSTATQSKFAITSYAYETSHTSGAKGLLKTETNPEGGATSYTYDAKGHMTSLKTPRNITVSYTNNIIGWRKTENNSKGTTYYYYDKHGNLTLTKYPDDGYERNLYNFRDQIVCEISPEVYVAGYDMSTFSTQNIVIAQQINPATKGTRYIYNAKGQMTSMTDLMNNVTSYTYDIYGNLASETKPNGAVYYYEYDVMNRLKYEKFAESAGGTKITLAMYNYGAASGGGYYEETRKYLTSSTYASTKLTYDFAGRQIRQDDPLSKYTLKEYYPDGKVKTETDELGSKTLYAYNGQGLMSGRWQQATASEYIYTGYEYDKCGRLRFERKSKSYTAVNVVPTSGMLYTEYIYNADGTLKEKKTSGGKRTTYAYDDEGNIASESLYKDTSAYDYRSYTYNHRGQILTENLRAASADIGLTGTEYTTLTTTRVYDKDGHLSKVTNPIGTTVTYDRDLLGRELSVITAESGDNNAVTLYSYDSMGNKTSETDARTKTTAYTYNKRGFLTHITNPLGGVTYYDYDYAGRKVAEVSPKNYITGSAISAMTRTSYTYDKMDRLTGIARVYKNDAGTQVTVQIASNEYDAAGNLKQSADKVEKLNNVYTIYEYDKADRLVKTRDPKEKNTSNQVVYDESAQVWDAAGRITSETDFNGHETLYGYDDDGNVLVTTKGGIRNAYTWDKLTNKLSETDGNGNTTQWKYNAFGKVRKTIYPAMAYPNLTYSTSPGVVNDGIVVEDNTVVIHASTYSTPYNTIKTVYLNDNPYPHEGAALEIVFVWGNAATDMQLDFYEDESESVYLGSYTVANPSAIPESSSSIMVAFTLLQNDTLVVTGSYTEGFDVVYSAGGGAIAMSARPPSSATFNGIVTGASGSTLNIRISQSGFVPAIGVLVVLYGMIDPQATYSHVQFSSSAGSNIGNPVTLSSITEGDGSSMIYLYNPNSAALLMGSPDTGGFETGGTGDPGGGSGAQTSDMDPTVSVYEVTSTYTKLGEIASEIDSMGKKTAYTYDFLGNMLSATESKQDGTKSITKGWRYDKSGKMIKTIDENGQEIVYTYDDLGRKKTSSITVTNVSGVTTTQTTNYSYDANSKLIEEENWRGNAYVYEYDKFDRLIKIKSPTGAVLETLGYDNSDSQTSSTDALGSVKYYYYDYKGRVIKEKDALAHETKRTYDGMGNVKTETDARNKVTAYDYNAFGKLTKVINALGEITEYTYDANGNMLTHKDARNHTTNYYYTSRNLMALKVEPGGILANGAVSLPRSTRYTYYANGLTASMTDPNNTLTSYGYDIHSRLIEETAGDETASYTYDNKGNKLTAAEGGNTITREYDSLGRVIKKQINGLSASTYQYDITSGVTAGYIAELTTDPKGNTVTKTYDKEGRLYRVTSPGGNITYDYYANGSKKKISYPGSVTAEYTYYDDNKLETLVNKKGSTILEAYSYNYDASGNISSKTDVKGTTIYTYDNLNRLETVSEPGSKTSAYIYDKAGNRISETKTASGVIAKSTSYQYDWRNRMVGMLSYSPENSETAKTVFTYDNNGNTLEEDADDVITSFTYDERNRMINTSGNGYTYASDYNAEGYRIKKTVTGSGAGTTQYLYEYDKVVLEMNASGTETGRNVYGDDTLLYRKAGSTTLYYLYNGHGDVTALVNSSGTVTASYYYDAFGVVTSEIGGTTAANNSYRYSGYQYDKEGGLYYLNSRYYAPKIARFMSQDTYAGNTRDPLSLNLYTYSYNNPIRYYDPTGHVVTAWDKANCTPAQIATIEKATKDYDAAKAKGDQAGMNAAHTSAVNARNSSGQVKNDQTVNSYGYVVSKTTGAVAAVSSSSGSKSSSSGNKSSSTSNSSSTSSSTSNSSSTSSGRTASSISNGIESSSKASDISVLDKGSTSEAKDTNVIAAPSAPVVTKDVPPTSEDGYYAPRGGPKEVPSPTNPKKKGWEDKNGNVWV